MQKITDSRSLQYHSPAIDPHLSLLIRVVGEEKEMVQKARELFQAEDSNDFPFHIGWVYGNFNPATKGQIIRSIQESIPYRGVLAFFKAG